MFSGNGLFRRVLAKTLAFAMFGIEILETFLEREIRFCFCAGFGTRID
jgi:hypothetical protein